MDEVNFEEALWHVYDCSRTLNKQAWDNEGVEIVVDEALVNIKVAELLVINSRKEAYPSLTDQADMQFHDAVDGTTTWQDAIQAVKDAYPKP
jgi:nitrate/nitrite-specific signal transduction histidine kinase